MQTQKAPIPLPEVAKAAGISNDKARHWVVALGYSMVKVGRCRHAPPEVVPQVQEMARLVTGGMSPQAAAATLRAVPVVEPTIALTVPEPGQVEKVLSLLVETFRQEMTASRQEVAAIRATVERQAEEIRTLRTAFLPVPSADPPRQVEAWKPERRPDPGEGMPWWKIAWLSLVAPEQLRRFES